MTDPKAVQSSSASAEDAAFFQEIEALQGKRPLLVLPAGLTADDIAALSLIAAERARQITAEGHAPERDDGYEQGELERAGAEYLLHAGGSGSDRSLFLPGTPCHTWPWDAAHWKPTTRLRDGVKGCALGLAGVAARLRRGEPVEG